MLDDPSAFLDRIRKQLYVAPSIGGHGQTVLHAWATATGRPVWQSGTGLSGEGTAVTAADGLVYVAGRVPSRT